jgi:hypothetical protein
MFLKLLIISAILMLTAFAGLAIGILLNSDRRFPETHISRNTEMQKRGISCAQKTDIGCTISDGSYGCPACRSIDATV